MRPLVTTKQKMIEYKIKDVRKTTNEKLLDNTNWDIKDLKFIVFEYLIPRSMGSPIKRYSKIYCLNKSDEVGNLGLKYKLYNYIVSFSVGLPFTYKKMKSSNEINKNGIDITEELGSKITIKDIENGILQLQLPLFTVGFTELNKEMKTVLNSSFNELKLTEKLVSNPVVGYVKNNGKHFFYIGLLKEELVYKDIFLQKLKKNISSTAKFEFINIEKKENELVQLLLKEGTPIKTGN